MSMVDMLKKMHKDLVKSHAELLKVLDPKQKEYDEYSKKINELDAKQRPLGNALKELKSQKVEIEKQMSGLRSAIGESEFEDGPDVITDVETTPAPGTGDLPPAPEENLY